jgi:hypothetical protein
MVSNTTTNRETAADHTPCLRNHSKKLGFEQEKGATKGIDRSFYTVQYLEDRPTWGTTVESRPAPTNLRSQ